jgi:hypothetical protein
MGCFVERNSDGKIVSSYALSQRDGMEELPNDDAELVAFLNPPVPETYRLFKTTLWMRLSDEDAEIVMAAKDMQPAKFRGIWDDAQVIESDSEFFDTLKSFLTVTLGAEKAGTLLRPES